MWKRWEHANKNVHCVVVVVVYQRHLFAFCARARSLCNLTGTVSCQRFFSFFKRKFKNRQCTPVLCRQQTTSFFYFDYFLPRTNLVLSSLVNNGWLVYFSSPCSFILSLQKTPDSKGLLMDRMTKNRKKNPSGYILFGMKKKKERWGAISCWGCRQTFFFDSVTAGRQFTRNWGAVPL